MSDGVATITDPTTQPGSAEATTAAPAADIASLTARLEKLEAEKAKLINENVTKKTKEREALAAAAKAAEEQGQFKEALEMERKRVAELAGYEDAAKKWQAYEATATERLAKEAEALPPAFRALFDAAVDVAAKDNVLAAYKSVTAADTVAAAKTAAAAGVGAPASSAGIDFAAAFQEGGERWAKARAADSKGADAYLASATKVRTASRLPPHLAGPYRQAP